MSHNEIVSGIANGWYEKYDERSSITIDLNALVTPHVGHGMCKKYLIGHPMPKRLAAQKNITEAIRRIR